MLLILILVLIILIPVLVILVLILILIVLVLLILILVLLLLLLLLLVFQHLLRIGQIGLGLEIVRFQTKGFLESLHCFLILFCFRDRLPLLWK